jgi:transketolase
VIKQQDISHNSCCFYIFKYIFSFNTGDTMPIISEETDKLAINTIRFLSVDAVQKAKSGHPGMPMGTAPVAYTLYAKYMKHNPENPKWYNRDRFLLSAGHGSMLLYSVLHLCGYDLPLEELKNFRQWESMTAGHPEHNLAPGIETTTGPLGQGFANAVGMAIGAKHIAAMFNKEDIKLIDHFIYGICSDGDLMEGLSHEAASLAGHLKLNNIIFFYDSNSITIDGSTSLAFSDDTAKRFEAYHWNVQHIKDVNNTDEIEKNIKEAQASDKPTLIITETNIGYGSPNKQDTAEAHGSPLGEEEVKLTKKNLGWPEDQFFLIPDEVKEAFKKVKKRLTDAEKAWQNTFNKYKEKYPSEAELFSDIMSGNYGDEWKKHLPEFKDDGKAVATRQASGKVINAIAPHLPGMIGGSADLGPSVNTYINNGENFTADNPAGRNIFFGVREHTMASILNGLGLYGGTIAFAGTFLIFSDYLRPAIRLGALSGVRPIYIFTHDSIGLGEDGPTHQPVEHLASLRAIPEVIVIRPADANETVYAWQAAIETKAVPVAIILSRQGLPVLDRSKYPHANNVLKGAYILKDTDSKPDVIIMATGSEVSPSLKAAELLEAENIKTRVVSFPSWELFDKQSKEYQETVLPSSVVARVSVEAGVSLGWHKYLGSFGEAVSVETFGKSAPVKILMEKFGFTPDNIAETARRVINRMK